MFFNSMKVYAVYVNPDKKNPYEAAEFIPEGFNIFAFIFAPIWTLYHKLWWLFTVVIILEVLDYVATTHWDVSHDILLPLQLGWAVIIGMNANDWWAENLHRRGWVITDIVTGATLVDAQQRFFDRHVDKLAESELHADQLALQI